MLLKEQENSWARTEALSELNRLNPRVKANRLAVDIECAEKHELSWPEMISAAHRLDNAPELVKQLAQEYDQLVRDGTYRELYGEYWPGKRLPPIIQI